MSIRTPLAPEIRTWRGLALAGGIAAFAALATGAAQAQMADAAPAPEGPPAAADAASAPSGEAAVPDAADANTLRYTLGARFKFADFAEMNRDTVRLRPVIGLRWGRWRLGIGDGTEWLRFAGFRREPGLSYEGLDTRRVKFGLSLRVLNIDTGQDWDPFESGRHTVRGRAMGNVDLGSDWKLGIDLGTDLLRKGDGSTLGLGFSHSFPLEDHHMLLASGGWTWGTGEHWRTGYRETPNIDLSTITTGWGAFSLGLAYRHKLTPAWSAFASAGPSRAIGQVSSVVGNDWVWSGQVGVLRFFR